jgi:beta-lactam-binding protein with PASTA domain
VAKPRQVLVVPDVRNQVFVFASGTLEDAGFGWKVRGSVHGFPANVVVSQRPKAGTRVIDTGAPTITLRLAPGKAAQIGAPQDRSPYGASLIRRPPHAHTR